MTAQEEKSKIVEDFDFPFGPSLDNESISLSSSSLKEVDFKWLNKYKDKRNVLPKLDPWLFKWIYQIYMINDSEIFQFTPADGYLYLYFLKGASILFSILTLLNCGILIPIYSGDGKLEAKNDLQVVNIGNIVKESNNSRMWVVFVVTIIVSLLTYVFIYIQKKRIDHINILTYDESLSDLDISKYAVLVRNVPTSLRSRDGDSMLFHFFREFYKDQIIGAHIIPNLAQLEETLEHRNFNLNKLGYYVEKNNKHGKRSILKRGTNFLYFKQEDIDAVNYYKRKIQEIDRDIPKLKVNWFKSNTGVAFVTFSSKETTLNVIKDFEKIQNSPVGFINKQLRIDDWSIERSSSPSDIIWKNLNKSYTTRYLRKVMIFIAILVISFLFITPLTIIDKLDYIRVEKEEFNIISLVTESYVSPLLLYFISSVFVPWVIRKISHYENHESYSRKESSIMDNNYIFIFLNWTIVPLINLTMLRTFIINRNIDYNSLLERVSHSTEFLLRFLVQITFVSWTIQLLASPYFATKRFKKWVNREYREEKWEFQEWFFNIGYSVPYNASIP